MKFNKLAASISLVAAVFIIGCGTSNDDNDTSETLTLNVVASDAYIVKLNTPASITIGNETYKTTEVENGIVKFKVPEDVDCYCENVKVYIPADALVDSNNNGKYDENDSKIRMPLETHSVNDKYANTRYVANPLTTTSIETNNTNLYNVVISFDPVEAKKELILNPDNNQTKVLVAVSEGIAILSQKVEEKDKDPIQVIKEINTSAIEEAYLNSNDLNITDLLNKTLSKAANYADIDLSSIIDKVNGIMNVINKASESIKDLNMSGNTISIDEVANQYTTLVIETSDGNLNPDTVVNNFDVIENNILNPNGSSNVQDIINQLETNTSDYNNILFLPIPPQIDTNNNEVNDSIAYPPAPPQILNN